MTGALALDGFAVALRGRTLVALDAVVQPGAVLTVMGSSGSGKTSLLLALAGLLGDAFEVRGQALLGGADLTALPTERRRLGLMFQDALLYPHMSVLGNVMFGVPRGPGRRAAALAQLRRVGLEALAARDPQSLSGGQRSRVALARTLAAGPRALLLDEPFAALDRALRADVRAGVLSLARAQGVPVVLATHDGEDAAAAGGRVVTIG